MEGKKTLMLMAAFILIKKAKTIRKNKKLKMMLPLREKCPNTEFFPVRIFSHSDRIRRDTPYLFVFSPNAGKEGAEKTPYLNTFYAVYSYVNQK